MTEKPHFGKQTQFGSWGQLFQLGPEQSKSCFLGGAFRLHRCCHYYDLHCSRAHQDFWTSPPITTPNLTTNERRQSFSTLLCIQAGSCLMPLAWLAKLRRGCRTLCKLLRSQEQFLASRRDTGIFSLYPCRRSVILRFNESLCLLSCPCCVVVLMVVAVVAFMNVRAMANIRAVPFTCDASSCSCPCCCCFVVAVLAVVVVVVPHITVWGSCFSLGSRRGSAPSPPPPPPPPPPPHSHSPLITHSLSPSFTSHLTHISSSLIT